MITDNAKCLAQVQSFSMDRKVKKDLIDLVNVENCHAVADKMNFKIFTDKPNIWGIRVDKGDSFNDLFHVFWREDRLDSNVPVWNSIVTYGTTEPAPGYIKKLIASGGKNRNGIFVLQANKQYEDCWIYGTHKGKYPALNQFYKFQFVGYRKKMDSDNYYEGVLYTDAAGIEFHTTKTGYYTNKIVGFSEGCQVIFDAKIYFEKIMPVLIKYRNFKYSYTLISDKMLLGL